MASPAADPVAQVQPQQQPQQQSHVDIGANVNGLATDEATPSDSGGPTAKRKREATDEGSERSENNHDAKPIINGDHPVRDEKTLIRNYFTVLKRFVNSRLSATVTLSFCVSFFSCDCLL